MNLVETRTGTAVSLKNILFATDFSAASEAALPYAMAIAGQYGSTLHAAHVLPETSLLTGSGGVDPVTIGAIYEAAQSGAQEKMEHLKARLEGIPHQTHVCHGSVWEGLCDLIRTRGIDLLVLGTHGRTGLGKLLMGSVAEAILRQSPCPVLTVGPRVSGHARLPALQDEAGNLAPAEVEIRQIVYATDLDPEAARAASYAFSLAQEFQAQLTLMHVIEKYAEQLHDRERTVETLLRRLEELTPEDAGLWYSPEPVVKFGIPADSILETAVERDADLIVLGVRPATGHLAAATHLLQATAHRVIAWAHCPVLTVRHEGLNWAR